jgi:CheY-like chemotaxis protein
LCVEDNPVDLFTIERALTDTRYQCIPARTVAQARRAVEHFTPVVILLDVVLLGDESWRYILELKQDDQTASIPILVSSATGESRKALHLGADEYLTKPIDPTNLLDLLDRLTGHRSVQRVLLVDDEEITRYLVRQLLPRGRFALKEMANGSDGLAEIQRELPDVVILDLNMPGMTGFELLERLRRDEHLQSLPAIVLTSAVLDDKDRHRLAGASAILSKSDLTSSTLIHALTQAIAASPIGPDDLRIPS